MFRVVETQLVHYLMPLTVECCTCTCAKFTYKLNLAQIIFPHFWSNCDNTKQLKIKKNGLKYSLIEVDRFGF